ncbi:245_t:CDS:2, partial [Diversispora eburnea]
WLKNYGLEQGFAITITHSEKDKKDGLPQRRIYTCTRGRKYTPRKEAHTKESRNAEHNTGNCQFRVNTYCQKNDNLVYITKVENQHNHKLVETIAALASSYQKFTPEMQEDIRLLATCGVRSGAIIEVLRHKNLGNDAGSIYLNLIKQQQENPSFYVDAQFEGQENRLVWLCWMRPSQQELWTRFHDIVLLDTTTKTNRHSMILCVVIIVDNHDRSRLAATAILSDETKDSFAWLFQSLLDATGGLMPRLLYTDTDPAMIAS